MGTFNICWGGVYSCVRVLPMLQNAGGIVNTSSINGFGRRSGHASRIPPIRPRNSRSRVHRGADADQCAAPAQMLGRHAVILHRITRKISDVAGRMRLMLPVSAGARRFCCWAATSRSLSDDQLLSVRAGAAFSRQGPDQRGAGRVSSSSVELALAHSRGVDADKIDEMVTNRQPVPRHRVLRQAP